MLGRVACAALMALAITGCGARDAGQAVRPRFPRSEVIAELQDFQESLGIERTGNFRRYSDAPHAIDRCYFTGQLELPDSYAGLRVAQSAESRCPVDESTHDVFLYVMEAVASGASPVSPALAQAPLERVMVIVAHEDFHDQRETKAASPEIAEAAATLIGFLTAGEFAKVRYGSEPHPFRYLDREAGLFLEKAKIVNLYFERLAEVYSSFQAGHLTREEALLRKERLFTSLQQECAALSAAPVSFNRCPAAMNNAGLAFDRTYTRYYPVLFDLHVSLGLDAGASVGALKRLLASGPQSEADLAEALSMMTRE